MKISAIVHVLSLTVFLLFVSCGGGVRSLPEIGENETAVFLLPNGFDSYNTKPLIKISNLNNGGFSLIITDNTPEGKKIANELYQSLVRNQIIAIHTINLKSRALKNTERIKIENARLILFAGDFNDFANYLNSHSKFKPLLESAYKNSATIAMYGRSGLYSGSGIEDSNENGLGLIDRRTFFNDKTSKSDNRSSSSDSVLFLDDNRSFIIINQVEVYELEDNWKSKAL